jgi:hypothetical protein
MVGTHVATTYWESQHDFFVQLVANNIKSLWNFPERSKDYAKVLK